MKSTVQLMSERYVSIRLDDGLVFLPTFFDSEIQLKRASSFVACWKGYKLELTLFVRDLSSRNHQLLELVDTVSVMEGHHTCSPVSLSPQEKQSAAATRKDHGDLRASQSHIIEMTHIVLFRQLTGIACPGV
jgi:hypothetical protein